MPEATGAMILPRVHLNEAIPLGVLAGFNAEGRVIVCIEWGVGVEFLIGSEHDRAHVYEWSMSAAQDRRARWMHSWLAADFPCVAGVM